MATEQSKSTDTKASEPKQPAATASTADSAYASEGDQRSNASTMVGYRGDHVGAKEAALKAAEEVAKAEAETLKNAIPAEQAGFNPNPYNQVPQEGALVETPPQPVPPSYSDAELKEMDHAPEGLREPSVAAKSNDTDQTVHPQSRVNDPSKPL